MDFTSQGVASFLHNLCLKIEEICSATFAFRFFEFCWWSLVHYCSKIISFIMCTLFSTHPLILPHFNSMYCVKHWETIVKQPIGDSFPIDFNSPQLFDPYLYLPLALINWASKGFLCAWLLFLFEVFSLI